MAHLKKRALAEFSQVIQDEARPPQKKLRLISKPKIVEAQLNLQYATTSHEALQCLLRFQDSLPIAEEHVEQAIRALLEHIYREKETAVRAKIVMLLGQLSQTLGYDPSPLVDDIISALKREESHKVVSQMLGVLLTIGTRIPGDEKAHQAILEMASQRLCSRCQRVRCRALEVLGGLGCPGTQIQLMDFTKDGDPRVRAAALNAMLSWHGRGVHLERAVYEQACESLADSNETVRMMSTKLVWVVSQLYAEEIVNVPELNEQLRLIDDGFAKICNMVNDPCMRVRAEAAGLLGSLHAVSQRFLDQTLDKKLISNMRKKTTAHERQREHFKSGEWSSGKKWADDAPKENVAAENISLISSGACGAFVHGFEDEYMEVRNAAIDSLCELGTQSASFAAQSQDFLVDMFNDEIESVRLNAIHSLRKISHHIILREDQLDVIMGCLKDYSYEIRDALRQMFKYVKMATKSCLSNTVSGMLDNLKRYPQDKLSIWKCMQHLGKQQPHLALPMVPDLLSLHSYFETKEQDMDDPAYVSVLLLVFNAAVTCPTMVSLFPEHTKTHYTYLHDTFPDMVPTLKFSATTSSSTCEIRSALDTSAPRPPSPSQFLEQSLCRLQELDTMESSLATSLITMAIRDLGRVSEVSPSLAATAECVALYLQCQLSLGHVLTSRDYTTPTATHQCSTATTATVSQILKKTYQLEHQFVGLSIVQKAAIWQLRLRAQTLQLLALLRISTSGSTAACISYLTLITELDMCLKSHELVADTFMQSLLDCMNKLESCEPTVYLTYLQAALRHHHPRSLPVSTATCCLKRATAVTIEPTGLSTTELKFTAGLTLGLPLVAELHNVTYPRNVRIRVEYPDQEVHILIPKSTDIKQLSPLRHQLVTTVLLSHSIWSEASTVSISIVLRYEADKEISLEKTDKAALEKVIELCKPVKVLIAPKPVKK